MGLSTLRVTPVGDYSDPSAYVLVIAYGPGCLVAEVACIVAKYWLEGGGKDR